MRQEDTYLLAVVVWLNARHSPGKVFIILAKPRIIRTDQVEAGMVDSERPWFVNEKIHRNQTDSFFELVYVDVVVVISQARVYPEVGFQFVQGRQDDWQFADIVVNEVPCNHDDVWPGIHDQFSRFHHGAVAKKRPGV